MKVHSGVGHQVFPQRGKVDRKFRYAAVLYRRCVAVAWWHVVVAWQHVAVAWRHVAEALARGGRRDRLFLPCLSPRNSQYRTGSYFIDFEGMKG